MNCKQFRLQLDGVEDAREALQLPFDMQAHLDSCAACQAHFRMHQRMLAAIESDPLPVLPTDFTEKTLGRLEPVAAPARAKIYLTWKRMIVYAGYALVPGLALWFSYKNIHFSKVGNLIDSPFAQQIRQWLTAVGAMEFVQSLGRLISAIFSFIPTTGNLIEKIFGKEVLPQAFNLIMILILTYIVAKASVFIEGWVRQISRR